MVAFNGSIEWSTDWIAVLLGASVPFASNGVQPWVVALGIVASPF